MRKISRFLFRFGIIRGVFNALSVFGSQVNIDLPIIIHSGRKSAKKLERLDFSEVLFVRSIAKNKEEFIEKCESGEFAKKGIQIKVYLYKRSKIVKEIMAYSPLDSLRCTFNKSDGGKMWGIYADARGLNSKELSHEDIFYLAINESKKNNDDPLQ